MQSIKSLPKCWKTLSRLQRKWVFASWRCKTAMSRCFSLLSRTLIILVRFMRGSLFTAGEYIGGPIYVASFDYTRFYPIVKAINIQFRRPATTDVTVEATLSEAEVNAIQGEAEAKGKADWKMDLEIKDQAKTVCSLIQGVWQLRVISEGGIKK